MYVHSFLAHVELFSCSSHIDASEMEKIFKKKIVVKKQPNALEMTLSVAQLSRLKLKSLSAKDRVREMGLHKDEVEMAFDYISAVDQVKHIVVVVVVVVKFVVFFTYQPQIFICCL